MPKSKRKVTAAFHGKSKDGSKSVFGILNLRVVITPDGDNWFAQGLEIDYASSGTTPDDVRSRFEAGLAATVHEHLKIYGSVERILKVAPPEVWKEMYSLASGEHFRFSQISFHRELKEALPFHGIDYIMDQAKVAATCT